MKRILIAGGSGLVGTALSKEVAGLDDEVIILSRSAGPGKITWNPSASHIDLDQPQFFDAIVNLAGSNIAGGRWTHKRKENILSSRLQSCHTLHHYLEKGLLKTNVYIGASGVGYYRDHGTAVVDESTPTRFPDDWLVNTVVQWEAAHQAISTLGIRTVIARFGIVLSTKGGAFREVLSPTRFGILGYFGAGKQYWPWIHIQDTAQILLHAIENNNMKGVYLVVSPHAVSNKSFTQSMNKYLSPHRLLLPAPRFALRLWLGEMHSVVFDSCRAVPKRLMEINFSFQFPSLDAAMKDLLSAKNNDQG